MQKIDKTSTSFPTTAQTAQQQGAYVASAFNIILRDKDVRKLFKELDEDQSGGLDAKEVKKGMKKLGLVMKKVG